MSQITDIAHTTQNSLLSDLIQKKIQHIRTPRGYKQRRQEYHMESTYPDQKKKNKKKNNSSPAAYSSYFFLYCKMNYFF